MISVLFRYWHVGFAIPAIFFTGITLSNSTERIQSIPQASTTTAQHSVATEDFTFSPVTIEIEAGDGITWTNHDFVPNTVTAVDGSWDSGLLTQDASFTLIVEENTILDYYCYYHPMMKATLTFDKINSWL